MSYSFMTPGDPEEDNRLATRYREMGLVSLDDLRDRNTGMMTNPWYPHPEPSYHVEEGVKIHDGAIDVTGTFSIPDITASDIRNMSMSQYAQFRKALGMNPAVARETEARTKRDAAYLRAAYGPAYVEYDPEEQRKDGDFELWKAHRERFISTGLPRWLDEMLRAVRVDEKRYDPILEEPYD